MKKTWGWVLVALLVASEGLLSAPGNGKKRSRGGNLPASGEARKQHKSAAGAGSRRGKGTFIPDEAASGDDNILRGWSR